MDKDKKLFPQRLWDLVHDERYNRFLRWSDDGQRVYLNRNDFEEQYLRTPLNQFHTQKAISFVRQMNMYGFKKVDDCHYENDNFKRGCHHLIKRMVRRNSNRPHMTTTTASLASSEGQSMDVMRGNLIGHRGGGGSSSTSGNHNSSFNQHHYGISDTMMSCPGLHIPNEGLFNATGGPFVVTTDDGGRGGLDLGQSNNLRALYEQLVSLNRINNTTAVADNTTARESSLLGLSNSSMIQQLVRSSSQLGNLIGRNQTFAGTTPPLPSATTAAATTEGARIAHSSLASSLYQGLASPASRFGSGSYLLGDSCPLTATTTVTTTLSLPHVQYAGARGFNGTGSSSSSSSPQSIRSMRSAQNLVEAANRDAQLMAVAAAAAATASTQQPAHNHLAAQQLLQQTLIGSLMQLRLAAAAQLPSHQHQRGQSLTDTASIPQNCRDLNFLLSQNQHYLDQTQQAQMLQNRNSLGTLTANNDDVRMDEGTSECNPTMGRSSNSAGGGAAAVSSCSSASSSSSSSRNTSSRSSASLSLIRQSISNEMLRENLDQCSARHLPGCSGGGLNLSRGTRATGGESNFECPLETDEDDDDDDDYDAGRGPPSQGSNSSENTFQFGQQQQQRQSIQTRPAPAHCASRRQLDGTLFNLSRGKERENRSV